MVKGKRTKQPQQENAQKRTTTCSYKIVYLNEFMSCFNVIMTSDQDVQRTGHIKGTVRVELFGDNVREMRLRCCGHVLRTDKEFIGQMILERGQARGKEQTSCR